MYKLHDKIIIYSTYKSKHKMYTNVDPNYRYNQIQNNSNNNYPQNRYQMQIPSNSADRYVKFKQQPVNLSRMNFDVSLNQSNIYTKQGILKRNQVGWDAVKLKQYVTQQISQDYIKNQKMLQKFRIQAQQKRREKKFSHAFSKVDFNQKSTLELPPISSPTAHMIPIVNELTPNYHSRVLSYHHSMQPEEQQNMHEQQRPHYRNVGVNTHKYYQKAHLQKYMKLMNKYQTLKQKYNKQKNQRKIQRKKYEQLQYQKQRQLKSLQKIKTIQSELVNISTRIEASNQFLQDQLNQTARRNESRITQNKQAKNTYRRFKTQPHNKEQNDDNDMVQTDFQKILQKIKIPENPLKQYAENTARKQKSPTIVYTNKQKLNILNNNSIFSKNR